MNTKYDYEALERQYVTTDVSIRELARQVGMRNHSPLMEQAKKREWTKKRDLYRSRANEKALKSLATDEGERLARESRVRDHAIEAIDEAIQKMRADMLKTRKVERGGVLVDEPLVIIRPNDVANLIDRLNVLFGRPSTISEERSVGLNLSAITDPETLRAIVEATRDLPDAGREEASPLPRLEDTGPG